MPPKTWNRRHIIAALVVLCVLSGGVWGVLGMRTTAEAGPKFIVNGETVAESFRVERAIPDASDRVGFQVRVPDAVPGHLKLIAISTDVGGPQVDQNGQQHDLSWIRTAYLLYEDDHGQRVSISQSPPERSTKLAAGAHPRVVDAGDSQTTVMVSHQRADAVSASWDSPNATYSAIYVFPPEVLGQDEAQQVLLDMLGSMR